MLALKPADSGINNIVMTAITNLTTVFVRKTTGNVGAEASRQRCAYCDGGSQQDITVKSRLSFTSFRSALSATTTVIQ